LRSFLLFLRQNTDFTRLWIAQIISLFGDWFNIIALSALVAQYTNKSGLAVSGLLLARVLPPFLVSPFAGVLAFPAKYVYGARTVFARVTVNCDLMR